MKINLRHSNREWPIIHEILGLFSQTNIIRVCLSNREFDLQVSLNFL